MVKKITIFGVVFVAALVFWFAAKAWLEGPVKFEAIDVWLMPLATLIILTAAVGIGLMLIPELLYRIVLSMLVGVAFLIVFKFNTLYPGTFSALILLHLYAGKIMGEELTERTKINSRVILKRGLPWVVLPILIMISLAYFTDPQVQATARSNQLPPTIRQAISETVTTFLGSELAALPAPARKQVENRLIEQVTDQLTRLAKPYFRYAPPILAFGLFLILQGLSFIFVWLAIWLGMLIFLILKRAGFVKIVEREVKAETIVLS